jgi:hypothetical protein
MLTIGQYLAPSGHHLPVRRYVHPDTFRMFEREAAALGFTHAAVGALVRSSYHADGRQAQRLAAGSSIDARTALPVDPWGKQVARPSALRQQNWDIGCRYWVGEGPSAEVGGRPLCGPLPTFSMGCGRESTH